MLHYCGTVLLLPNNPIYNLTIYNSVILYLGRHEKVTGGTCEWV